MKGSITKRLPSTPRVDLLYALHTGVNTISGHICVKEESAHDIIPSKRWSDGPQSLCFQVKTWEKDEPSEMEKESYRVILIPLFLSLGITKLRGLVDIYLQ